MKHIIITVNIFAIKKTQSEQVLYVTFTKHGEESSGCNEKKAASEAIKEAANASKSYVIPVNRLRGMLAMHVNWTNNQAERDGVDHARVVFYHCTDFSYKEFGVVARVLNRCYIGQDGLS